MEQIYEERKQKIGRILEEYSKRKPQAAVAEMFNIPEEYVSLITQKHNYYHTVDLTQYNPKKKLTNPVIFYDDFEFLDEYPIEDFMK